MWEVCEYPHLSRFRDVKEGIHTVGLMSVLIKLGAKLWWMDKKEQSVGLGLPELHLPDAAASQHSSFAEYERPKPWVGRIKQLTRLSVKPSDRPELCRQQLSSSSRSVEPRLIKETHVFL